MLRLIHGFDGNMNCSGLTGVNRFIRGQKRNCSPRWRRYSEELSVEILMFAAAGGSGAGAELRGRFVRHGAISRRREWGQRRRGGVSLPNPDSGADRRWAIHLEFTVCAASICSSPRGCSSCSCGGFVGFSIRRVPSFSHSSFDCSNVSATRRWTSSARGPIRSRRALSPPSDTPFDRLASRRSFSGVSDWSTATLAVWA